MGVTSLDNHHFFMPNNKQILKGAPFKNQKFSRYTQTPYFKSGSTASLKFNLIRKKARYVQLLSEGILKELLSVEGRYIEWEWDPRTLTDDYIAMREPDGFRVAISNKNGLDHHLKVSPRALEELIQEQLISEDPSRRAPGFRLYRLNAEGRKRGGREC